MHRFPSKEHRVIQNTLPLGSNIPFAATPQDRRGPRPLPAADRGRRLPPPQLRHSRGAAGLRPQLHAHHAGDPGPAQGAEGLPAVLQAGEEKNHRGLHLRHPLGPAPGLKGAGSARARSHREFPCVERTSKKLNPAIKFVKDTSEYIEN